MTKQPKIFVLDTNVVLHDCQSIYNFQENDIILPIVVLEELDKFKKGNEAVNYNAREFARELDKLAGDKLFNGGIPLGKGLGKLRVVLGQRFTDTMAESFYEDTPDHRILATAAQVRETNPGRTVVLVTKDINLRLKAKSLGIDAQDYLTDKVANPDVLSREVQTVDALSDEQIARIYQNEQGLPLKEAPGIKPYANEYLILKGATSFALGIYDHSARSIKRVDKQRTYGIEPRNSEQTFAIDALMRPEIPLVALTGIAGTGKTLLALAAALAQEANFEQILLARPVIPLQNQEIGFLPGDVDEKIGPYMLPLFDNLGFIKSRFRSSQREYTHIEEMLKTQKLKISPLAYIRGRSLSNVFFIVDEAQNLTPHEVKTIITRVGEGTKLVFTGDIQQIDSPYLDISSNGLTYLSDKMTGQSLFTHVNLVKGERSRLAELAGNLL
ncbi:MAG: PhoH family protein [Prevotellaceae bacterium]|jgi:PhoH-like ATPase|nr:PhoH family protein [Prevotellaceae bacterium]